MRSAIVTTAALRRNELIPHQFLTFHWFVVEFNDKEIVLAETPESTEAVVVPTEDVVSIIYSD